MYLFLSVIHYYYTVYANRCYHIKLVSKFWVFNSDPSSAAYNVRSCWPCVVWNGEIDPV